MLAARSLSLDCGPMSGFDNAKVDQEFFPEVAPWTGAVDGGFIAAGAVKSNFLCNLGRGDASKLPPVNSRFAFEEVCKII